MEEFETVTLLIEHTFNHKRHKQSVMAEDEGVKCSGDVYVRGKVIPSIWKLRCLSWLECLCLFCQQISFFSKSICIKCYLQSPWRK